IRDNHLFCLYVQTSSLILFRLACIVYCGRIFQYSFFDVPERKFLQQGTTIEHSPQIQCSKRAHDVRDFKPPSPVCRGDRGKGEQRVYVHHIVLPNVSSEPGTHWHRSGIELSLSWEV